METINQNSEQYQYAKKQVKRLKGFYVHATIYLIVNTMLIFGSFFNRNFNANTFWSFETFATAFFWGIGLFSHGFAVFGKNLFFNKNWEDKKMREFMTIDKKSGWE